jgi:hypothetical protein
MSKEDISDDELEEMLERDLQKNEAKRDNCGKPVPKNREVGVQRTNVKVKDKK